MKDFRELRACEVAHIANSLRDIGYNTEDITFVLLDEDWKYCDSDQEIKDAFKELYGKEFNNDDDFFGTIRLNRDVIVLFSKNKREYLVKAKRNIESNNVYTLNLALKSRIAYQLIQKGFDIKDIVDIVFTQHEWHEWRYCEDFLDMKKAIGDGLSRYAYDPIIALYGTLGVSYLVCCTLK